MNNKLEQHSIPLSVALHLTPGILTGIAFFSFAPFAQKMNFPPFVELAFADLVMLLPVMYGILFYQGFKKNGRLSLEGVVLYRERIPGWHAPGYLGGWMLSTVPALLVYSIAFSILATWVYNNSHGSILLMILLHSSSNAAISVGARVLPADFTPAMHAFVFSGWIPAIMGGVIAILILIFTKGRLGYSKTM